MYIEGGILIYFFVKDKAIIIWLRAKINWSIMIICQCMYTVHAHNQPSLFFFLNIEGKREREREREHGHPFSRLIIIIYFIFCQEKNNQSYIACMYTQPYVNLWVGNLRRNLCKAYIERQRFVHACTGVNLFMNFVLHTLSQPTFYSNLCKRERERE